uniref:Uncharacterized protein n=1 Tax=Anguilla anguilla TaxID=7936 RepID=A0A0E9T3N2_ANGAN
MIVPDVSDIWSNHQNTHYSGGKKIYLIMLHPAVTDVLSF